LPTTAHTQNTIFAEFIFSEQPFLSHLPSRSVVPAIAMRERNSAQQFVKSVHESTVRKQTPGYEAESADPPSLFADLTESV
jgi:hypothetical protein